MPNLFCQFFLTVYDRPMDCLGKIVEHFETNNIDQLTNFPHKFFFFPSHKPSTNTAKGDRQVHMSCVRYIYNNHMCVCCVNAAYMQYACILLSIWSP